MAKATFFIRVFFSCRYLPFSGSVWNSCLLLLFTIIFGYGRNAFSGSLNLNLMLKFNFFFSLILSLALFSSCDKEQEEPQIPEVTQQDCLLSKVLDQNNNVILEIIYNSSGQFIEYKDFEYGDSYAITYSNDKITSATHSYNRSASSNYSQKLEFNSIGFITKSTYNHVTSGDVLLSFPVHYNNDDQLENIHYWEKFR
ncbi:hypothetical protein [Adhaeribacter terreus]|uniref:DUF4595 domain-containing protein n=1 Tax=Adhaeribacter terreus TaxID=529703 RepID=A0ABW0ECL1_9BACT